ncbi:MAG TPA: Fic family protein [Candidatus Nanoarchaeia archaeon]|nr:Fic family protein [Candidatus Nanoarchaeia archaeon]
MVTKYDIFMNLYGRGGSRRIIDVLKDLQQKKFDYDKIRKILENLVEMKLVHKNKSGYERIMNPPNQHLFEMLRHCLQNGVNYNDLFNETVAQYLHKAFLKKYFTADDINLHPRTFSRISSLLVKNGFLIILSRKPFKAMVPYNSFLGDLVIYYGFRPLIARQQQDEYFEEIQKELVIFKKLRSRNIRKYQEIMETFQIRFIHHSLSIEGNPFTLAQTIKLLRDQIVPENLKVESVHEVQNYQKAFVQMLQNVRDELPLTKESILNYHFLAMQHKPQWAGKIRDEKVIIRGNDNFKVADLKAIEPLLDCLIEKYNEFGKVRKHSLSDIFEFTSYLHNEFQHIHPFFDGNSRTTRLLTFHFLQMNEIPIFDIPLGLLEGYVFSTKGAKKRDDHRLSQVLQQIILYNLKTINEHLR